MTRSRGAQQEGENGFTLVEVLVAFAILALSMGFVYQSFTTSSRGLSRLSERAEALALSETLLARIGVDIPLAVGTREGDFDLEGYRWRVTVRTSNLLEGQDRARRGLYPYEVEADVFRTGTTRRLASFKTLKLGRK